MSDRHYDYDCVFVGGGLSNSLLAYWIRQRYPKLKILILEQGEKLGGNHTWSFHEGDLTQEEFQLVEPFISKRWEGYSVAFPKHSRRMDSSYYSIKSERLHERVSEQVETLLETQVTGVAPFNITGKNGQQWAAKCVFDGRGFPVFNPEMVAFQKFVGLDLELIDPHGLTEPILMDATCPQLNSFRFFYCLPWDEKRLLVEDTRYSDTGEVDSESFGAEIKSFCEKKGWKIARILREEVGSLPIPLRAKYLLGDKGQPEGWMARLVPCLGVRGGFFHSTTGYSLPDTVRAISKILPVKTEYQSVYPIVVTLSKQVAKRQWFFRFLNRLLFQGCEANCRYRILEFFYRMPKGLIRRFYAGKLWPTDYIRIFLGAPPIKIRDAFRCLFHNRERFQQEKVNA